MMPLVESFLFAGLASAAWVAAPTWLPVGWNAEKGLVELGSRLELFVDDFLIAELDGAELRLNAPRAEEIAIVLNMPWEGETSAYPSVLHTPDGYFLYYRGSGREGEPRPEVTCVATSPDGIHWTRPQLGIYEWEGDKANNIILMGDPACHNFAPFYDRNPNCPPDQRYKAVGGLTSAWGGRDLRAYVSADGLHWRLMRDEPIISGPPLDSLNLAFWDEVRGCYIASVRNFTHVRTFQLTWSGDFINWAPLVWADLGEGRNTQLYTTALEPYFRAPHLLLGFPKRFFEDRKVLPDHPYPGVSDAGFMVSRDALHFYLWPEAFVRPGLDREDWGDRSRMPAHGIVQTGEREISIYITEHYRSPSNRIRRFSLPLDRFASIHARAKGGQVITKPFTFEGSGLVLNCSTSAGGMVKVELQDPEGKALPGFELDRCRPVIGDGFELPVVWQDSPSLAGIAGRPVRMRLVLWDADVYAFMFT